MKTPLKLLWEHIVLAVAIVAAIAFVTLIFDTCCPLYILTGLQCPFCGMTRAHFALLRLDFGAAFDFNPLYPLGMPYLLLILHSTELKKRFGKTINAALIVLSALFLSLFIYRTSKIFV